MGCSRFSIILPLLVLTFSSIIIDSRVAEARSLKSVLPLPSKVGLSDLPIVPDLPLPQLPVPLPEVPVPALPKVPVPALPKLPVPDLPVPDLPKLPVPNVATVPVPKVPLPKVKAEGVDILP